MNTLTKQQDKPSKQKFLEVIEFVKTKAVFAKEEHRIEYLKDLENEYLALFNGETHEK